MKNNKLGITEGEFFALDYAGIYCIQTGEFYGDDNVLDCENYPEEEVKANAELFADAGTTANKCGKLPSELLKERDELKTFLETLLGSHNGLALDYATLLEGNKLIQSIEK